MKIEKSTFRELDQLIREGQHALAGQQLNLILQSEIPREFLFETAAISRRLSRSEIGVGLLNPIVRPPATKNIVATNEERAEYAACLVRLGSLKEAHAVLDTVSPSDVPRSLLFRAFAYIAHWDFEKSQECLEKFMKSPQADSYEILIAKVNLSLGHVFLEKFAEAEKLLNELCKVTLENKNFLLYANALELAAQSAILSRDFSLADRLLQTATHALTSSETIDAFFLKKDQAVLELFKSKNSAASIERLRQIKREAQQRKFWEQSRDCDYYLAIATQDLKIASHLYFGTPYQAYRQKFLSKLNLSPSSLPDEFHWRLGQGSKKSTIHVNNGKNSCTKFFMNEGQVPQRLLKILAADYYRPRRMMEMFEGAFPEEYFMPKYSADKLHQGLKRLRAEIKNLRVPVLIEEKSGFYQLAAVEGHSVDVICSLRKETHFKEFLTRRQSSRVFELLNKYKTSQGRAGFSAKDFALFHNISERSALRHLRIGVEKGWLRREGKARFTKYFILAVHLKTTSSNKPPR